MTAKTSRADVVVVGAGIIGLALAWRLQEAGLATVVLEAGRAGGGTSSATFAWINATSKTGEEAYHRLNAGGVGAWHALAHEHGAETLGLCGRGSLQWTTRKETAFYTALQADRAVLQGFDYPAEWMDRIAIRATVPAFEDLPPDAEGLWAPADRWLEVDRFLAVARERFFAAGGVLLEEDPVLGRDDDGRVRTAKGAIAAERVVVAAGTASTEVLRRLGHPGLPAKAVPGFLVETPPTPLGERLDAVLWSPDPAEIHIRPTAAGGLLIGADDLDAVVGAGGDADAVQGAKQELLARAVRWFPRLPQVALANELGWRIGHRPMPRDGRSIVGPLAADPSVFVAVTHSGVTLAPYLAVLLTAWLASGRRPKPLASFGPERFGL